MSYSNGFVLNIIVNGKIVQPKENGECQIPWGDYSIRLRNKNDRQAVATIYLDGENVSGGGYVIPAYSYVDIKRYVDEDRTFRFVPLGDGEGNENKQKGVVEVRFKLEKKIEYKPLIVIKDKPIKPCNPWDTDHPFKPYGPIWTGDDNKRYTYPGTVYCSMSSTSSVGDEKGILRSNTVKTCGFNSVEEGKTVKGGQSGQQFTTTWVNTEESETIIKLFLRGYEEKKSELVMGSGQPNKAGLWQPKYCSNCGAKIEKKNANFCSICGQNLKV